jgi:hypothetical protein
VSRRHLPFIPRSLQSYSARVCSSVRHASSNNWFRTVIMCLAAHHNVPLPTHLFVTTSVLYDVATRPALTCVNADWAEMCWRGD